MCLKYIFLNPLLVLNILLCPVMYSNFYSFTSSSLCTFFYDFSHEIILMCFYPLVTNISFPQSAFKNLLIIFRLDIISANTWISTKFIFWNYLLFSALFVNKLITFFRCEIQPSNTEKNFNESNEYMHIHAHIAWATCAFLTLYLYYFYPEENTCSLYSAML